MKFRKKPVVIEAVQYDGRETQELVAHIGDRQATFYTEDARTPPRLEVATLEGAMRADVGDWIIKGVKGEIYPCKPDIFAATYEKAE